MYCLAMLSLGGIQAIGLPGLSGGTGGSGGTEEEGPLEELWGAVARDVEREGTKW